MGGGGAHPRSYRWSRAEPGWGLGSLSPRGWLYIVAQSFLQLQTTSDEPHLFGEEEVIIPLWSWWGRFQEWKWSRETKAIISQGSVFPVSSLSYLRGQDQLKPGGVSKARNSPLEEVGANPRFILLPAVWFRESHLTSLSLSVPICEMAHLSQSRVMGLP